MLSQDFIVLNFSAKKIKGKNFSLLFSKKKAFFEIDSKRSLVSRAKRKKERNFEEKIHTHEIVLNHHKSIYLGHRIIQTHAHYSKNRHRPKMKTLKSQDEKKKVLSKEKKNFRMKEKKNICKFKMGTSHHE